MRALILATFLAPPTNCWPARPVPVTPGHVTLEVAHPGSAIDADHDGYTVARGDCDDHDPAVNPGAEEIDGNCVDENCDGVVDAGSGTTSASLVAVGGLVLCGDTTSDNPERAGSALSSGVAVGSNLLVGAPRANDSGAVYVVAQSAIQDRVTAGGGLFPLTDLAPIKLTGPLSSEAGAAMLSQNLDEEGNDDLVVGAPSNGVGGTPVGTFYLLSGPFDASSDLASAASLHLNGTRGSDLGRTLAAARLTGTNGLPDLLVGAPGYNGGQGAVLLLTSDNLKSLQLAQASGDDSSSLYTAGLLLKGSQPAEGVGTSLATLSVDDTESLLIGAPEHDAPDPTDATRTIPKTGGVFVVDKAAIHRGSADGSGSAALEDIASKIVGPAVDTQAGVAVASGDLNSDGDPEILVATEGYDLCEDGTTTCNGVWSVSASALDTSVGGSLTLGEGLVGVTKIASWKQGGTDPVSMRVADLSDGGEDLILGIPGFGENGSVFAIPIAASTLDGFSTVSLDDGTVSALFTGGAAGTAINADASDALEVGAPDYNGDWSGAIFVIPNLTALESEL